MSPPDYLQGHDGEWYFPSANGPIEEQVRAINEPDALDLTAPPIWMVRVADSERGYPEGYESREEWEQSGDYTDTWWDGCQPPLDGTEREGLARFFVVTYKPVSESVPSSEVEGQG